MRSPNGSSCHLVSGIFSDLFPCSLCPILYHPNFYYHSFANFGYCTVETLVSEETLVEFSYNLTLQHFIILRVKYNLRQHVLLYVAVTLSIWRGQNMGNLGQKLEHFRKPVT